MSSCICYPAELRTRSAKRLPSRITAIRCMRQASSTLSRRLSWTRANWKWRWPHKKASSSAAVRSSEWYERECYSCIPNETLIKCHFLSFQVKLNLNNPLIVSEGITQSYDLQPESNFDWRRLRLRRLFGSRYARKKFFSNVFCYNAGWTRFYLVDRTMSKERIYLLNAYVETFRGCFSTVSVPFFKLHPQGMNALRDREKSKLWTSLPFYRFAICMPFRSANCYQILTIEKINANLYTYLNDRWF